LAELAEQMRDGGAGGERVAISSRCKAIASVLQDGKNQAGAFCLRPANGSENIGRRGSLIVRAQGRVTALGPTPSDLVRAERIVIMPTTVRWWRENL